MLKLKSTIFLSIRLIEDQLSWLSHHFLFIFFGKRGNFWFEKKISNTKHFYWIEWTHGASHKFLLTSYKSSTDPLKTTVKLVDVSFYHCSTHWKQIFFPFATFERSKAKEKNVSFDNLKFGHTLRIVYHLIYFISFFVLHWRWP